MFSVWQTLESLKVHFSDFLWSRSSRCNLSSINQMHSWEAWMQSEVRKGRAPRHYTFSWCMTWVSFLTLEADSQLPNCNPGSSFLWANYAVISGTSSWQSSPEHFLYTFQQFCKHLILGVKFLWFTIATIASVVCNWTLTDIQLLNNSLLFLWLGPSPRYSLSVCFTQWIH